MQCLLNQKLNDLVKLNNIYKNNMNPFNLHDMKIQSKIEKQIKDIQHILDNIDAPPKIMYPSLFFHS